MKYLLRVSEAKIECLEEETDSMKKLWRREEIEKEKVSLPMYTKPRRNLSTAIVVEVEETRANFTDGNNRVLPKGEQVERIERLKHFFLGFEFVGCKLVSCKSLGFNLYFSRCS